MTTRILADRELADLIDRLDASHEALFDDLPHIVEPSWANAIARDIETALAALDAAASYLHRLRDKHAEAAP